MRKGVRRTTHRPRYTLRIWHQSSGWRRKTLWWSVPSVNVEVTWRRRMMNIRSVMRHVLTIIQVSFVMPLPPLPFRKSNHQLRYSSFHPSSPSSIATSSSPPSSCIAIRVRAPPAKPWGIRRLQNAWAVSSPESIDNYQGGWGKISGSHLSSSAHRYEQNQTCIYILSQSRRDLSLVDLAACLMQSSFLISSQP